MWTLMCKSQMDSSDDEKTGSQLLTGDITSLRFIVNGILEWRE